MDTKEKLSDILEDFKKDTAFNEIFGKTESSQYSNITLHFDTVNKEIGVYTDKVDAKGRPVLQWEMNTGTGHTTTTKRSVDGQEVMITHKDVDAATLNKEQNAEKIKKDVQDSREWIAKIEQKQADLGVEPSKDKQLADVEDEWNDLEKQRDIAFKIMYFFIVFIIATFSLLYAFFRMTQNSEQEAAMRKGVKGQRAVRDQQQTFFDFLAGQMDDENYVVNPYARKTANQTTAQFTSASTPFVNLASQSYDTARQLARKAQNSKGSASVGPDHRQNAGFGANNLEHLGNEERGRFDDLEVETPARPDFTKLGNFSNL